MRFSEWLDQPYRLYGSRKEWMESMMPTVLVSAMINELELAYNKGCDVGFKEAHEEFEIVD
jgi:hypothetical protein